MSVLPRTLDAFALRCRESAIHLDPSARDDRTLAAAVSHISEVYNRQREHLAGLDGSADLAARAAFFLPRDLTKVVPPLEEAAGRGLLQNRSALDVLDLGVGLGATAFGTALWAAQRGIHSVTVEGFEKSERTRRALRQLVPMFHEFTPGLVLQSHSGSLASASKGSEQVDIILLGLVLNELSHSIEKRSLLLKSLIDRLRPDGVLIVIEPAHRAASRALMEVRDQLLSMNHVDIVGPCLHRRPCPMLRTERDWCHVETREPLPSPIQTLAQMAGLRSTRPTWSYLTAHSGKFGLADPAVTLDESNEYRVVSAARRSKGKVEFFLCGEAGFVRAQRLIRDESHSNASFSNAIRGSRMRLSQPTGTEYSNGPAEVSWTGKSLRVKAEDRVEVAPLGENLPGEE
ncbi:MAG: small ribosomal subunit Rsm22 family protein [Myxococcota bacterium]